MYQPCNNKARSGLISHALKGASRIARGALVRGPCYFQPQCVAPHSPLTAQTTTPWCCLFSRRPLSPETRDIYPPGLQLRLYIELKSLEIRTEVWEEPVEVLGEGKGSEERLNPLEARWNHEPLDHTRSGGRGRLDYGCSYSREDGVEFKVRFLATVVDGRSLRAAGLLCEKQRAPLGISFRRKSSMDEPYL